MSRTTRSATGLLGNKKLIEILQKRSHKGAKSLHVLSNDNVDGGNSMRLTDPLSRRGEITQKRRRRQICVVCAPTTMFFAKQTPLHHNRAPYQFSFRGDHLIFGRATAPEEARPSRCQQNSTLPPMSQRTPNATRVRVYKIILPIPPLRIYKIIPTTFALRVESPKVAALAASERGPLRRQMREK